ncbi:hypothetical protein RB195_022491 [Necator americanus]|uniref:Reverse transcriptase domain-containing protein n=1 Tax=Necator americanus TaxID=51031 RepID=A0ABR1EI35_NECAM
MNDNLSAGLFSVARLFQGNCLIIEKDHRQWTWESPNGVARAEIDHILTNRRWCLFDIVVIEVCREYLLPLALTFVDYEKAFDSVETKAILSALVDQAESSAGYGSRTSSTSLTKLENLDDNGKGTIRVKEMLGLVRPVKADYLSI